MIYELRRYEVLPGKMAALDTLMKELAVPLFEKHGMRLVGAWTPKVGEFTNVLHYILAFESMDDRDRRWQAFFEDPEWVGKRGKYAGEGGTLVARQHYTFFTPTSYSPLR